jgi:hypothetical protein
VPVENCAGLEHPGRAVFAAIMRQSLPLEKILCDAATVAGRAFAKSMLIDLS